MPVMSVCGVLPAGLHDPRLFEGRYVQRFDLVSNESTGTMPRIGFAVVSATSRNDRALPPNRSCSKGECDSCAGSHVLRRDRPAVRFSHRTDDRKPQTDAAPPLA